MKKTLPVPAIVATVAAALLVVGFLLFRGASGPSEFPAPVTTKTIPRHIWDGMTPAMQEKNRQAGYVPGDVSAPTGSPNGAPSGRPGAPR